MRVFLPVFDSEHHDACPRRPPNPACGQTPSDFPGPRGYPDRPMSTPATRRVVLCTCPDRPVADRIAEALVNESLAACVNILGGVTSVYRWEGKLERGEEVLLVIKTAADRLPELEARIRALHPYTVPEIVALPITEGFSGYLAWIDETTR